MSKIIIPMLQTPPKEKPVDVQVLEIYSRYRRKITPEWIPSHKFDDVWLKIAELIQTIHADPRLFVEAQFELGTAKYGQAAIMPHSLAGKKAAQTYSEYLQDFKPIPERTVEQAMRRLAVIVGKAGLTTDQACLHPEAGLPSWFRILACSEDALPQVRETHLNQALVELRRDPDLSSHLSSKFNDRYEPRIRTAISGHLGNACYQGQAPSEPSYLRPALC